MAERFGPRQTLSLSRPEIRQLLATYRGRLGSRFGPIERLPFFPSSRGEGFTAPSRTRFLNICTDKRAYQELLLAQVLERSNCKSNKIDDLPLSFLLAVDISLRNAEAAVTG